MLLMVEMIMDSYVELFGFNTVPYLVFTGFSQESVYQLNAYGNNSFVSTTNEQGLRIFNSVLSLPLYLTLDTDIFDNSGNRTLRLRIREGENLNNTIVYTNDIIPFLSFIINIISDLWFHWPIKYYYYFTWY